MKFRTDFVTNSSSSIYAPIGSEAEKYGKSLGITVINI